jgi:hypothetical protein
MTRSASAGVIAAVAANVKRPAFFVAIETTGGWVRAWNGVGELSWGGLTFAGVGVFGGISPITESTDLRAVGIRFTLSGVPAGQIAAAQLIRQGLPALVWMGFLDDTFRLIADPIQLYNGKTDTVTLEDLPEGAVITVSAETEFIDQRRRVFYYTTEDQKLIDPTDIGFDYVPLLQDQQLTW